MNLDDPNDQNTGSETKPAAFCQNCGKPLSQETMRVVGPAVYCEPCLAARLSGAAGAGANQGGPAVGPAAETAWQWGSGIPAGWAQRGGPNPGLAAVLGLIPGVGAMYNEQYAKGIFHLIVFAVLTTLSHSIGVFGFFAFGWVCYMVIEAHHTARARRDGTPLPNPFGFNDLGERLGFGRAWAGGPGAGQQAAGAAGASQTYPPPPVTPYSAPAGTWGAPADAYNPSSAAYNPAAAAYSSGYGEAYGAYVPPVPPIPPYGAAFAPVGAASVTEAPLPVPPSRFPAGAVWLIGLGTIFLLSTTGIFHVFLGWSLVGFVLIGLAAWIFLRRLTDTGATLTHDGTAAYPARVVRALGPSIWVFTLGVLLLLDAFHLVPWHRSWPIFIILAGVMALLQRAAYNSAAAAAVPFSPGYSGPGYASPGYPSAGDPRYAGEAAQAQPSSSSGSGYGAASASGVTPDGQVEPHPADAANGTSFHEGGN